MKNYKAKITRFLPEEAAYIESLKRPGETDRQLLMRLAGRDVSPIKRGRPRIHAAKSHGINIVHDIPDKFAEYMGDKIQPTTTDELGKNLRMKARIQEREEAQDSFKARAREQRRRLAEG